MICYLTILDDDTAIVPFFVRWYSQLGATKFRVIVYGHPTTVENTCRIIHDLGFDYEFLKLQKSESFTAKKREQLIREHHPKGQWAFFADVDEFCEMTPYKFNWYRQEGFKYIWGRWYDRCGMDGKLMTLSPETSLEDQFPMGGKIRKELGMGDTCYVASSFAPSSHHPTACLFGQHTYHLMPEVRVHHFKWQYNVIDRLSRRLKRIEANGQTDTSWHRRVRKTIRYLEVHGGVDPKHLEYVGRMLNI